MGRAVRLTVLNADGDEIANEIESDPELRDVLLASEDDIRLGRTYTAKEAIDFILMEQSYLQAQADIAADPSLREQIEKARKNFDEGRFYTTNQAIDLIRRGSLPE